MRAESWKDHLFYNHFVGGVVKRRLRERRKKEKRHRFKDCKDFFLPVLISTFLITKETEKIIRVTVQKMRMTLKASETSNDHNSYSSMYKENL